MSAICARIKRAMHGAMGSRVNSIPPSTQPIRDKRSASIVDEVVCRVLTNRGRYTSPAHGFSVIVAEGGFDIGEYGFSLREIGRGYFDDRGERSYGTTFFSSNAPSGLFDPRAQAAANHLAAHLKVRLIGALTVSLRGRA